MSWRSRHAVSRGFEKRLKRLLPACATNPSVDKDVDFWFQSTEWFSGQGMVIRPDRPFAIIMRCKHGSSTTFSAFIYTLCASNTFGISCYLISHCASTSDVAPAGEVASGRHRSVVNDVLGTVGWMDIACTASHVIGPQRQGNL